MNKPSILALAAFAAIASTGVQADEADGSQFAHPTTNSRSRADVVAEAVQKARNFSPEPAGSRIAAPVKSETARENVRNEAGVALRAGKISSGEAGNNV